MLVDYGEEEKSLKSQPQLTGSVLGFGVVVDPTSSPRSFRPEGLWPSTCLEQSIGGDTVAVVLVVLVVTNRLRLESDEKASESTSGFGVGVVVFLGETVHAKSGECDLKTRYLLFSASTVSQFFCCVQFVKSDGVLWCSTTVQQGPVKNITNKRKLHLSRPSVNRCK